MLLSPWTPNWYQTNLNLYHSSYYHTDPRKAPEQIIKCPVRLFLQKLDKNLSLCLHLFFCTVYKHWKLTVLKLPTAARYRLLGDHRQPKACLALVLMVRKRLQSPCSSNSHSFTVPSREADAKLKLPS